MQVWHTGLVSLVKALHKALKDRSKPLKELRGRIEEVETALARYQEGFEQGAFTVNDVAERFRELAAQKRELEEEFTRKSAIKTFPAELAHTENVVKVQEQLKEVFRTASSHVKKQYLRVLIEHIIFDGKRVEVKARNDGIIAVLENLEALETGDVAKVMFEAKKWQPVGNSNPFDKSANRTRFIVIAQMTIKPNGLSQTERRLRALLSMKSPETTAESCERPANAVFRS